MSREWLTRRSVARSGMVFALLASLMLICAAAASACEADSAFGGFAPFLPDCREYELVTPPFKDGAAPEELASGLSTISSDGLHTLAVDTGAFAGAENDELIGKQDGAVYEFTRTSTGWMPESLVPPAEVAARSLFVAESADFSRSLWEVGEQTEPGEEVESTAGQFKLALREKLPGEPATVVEVGPEEAPGAPSHVFNFEGASRDLNTVVFGIAGKKTHWPGDKSRQSSESLYAYTGTHNREPLLVGVKNEGPLVGAFERNEHAELVSECGTQLGSGSAEGGSTFNAVSSDGSIIYFTALRSSCEAPAVNEIYARIGGAKTVAISEPVLGKGECSGVCEEDEQSSGGHGPSPATFQGASEDGRKVFFTTQQPLLNNDKDTSNDLYEAELEDGALTRLTMVSEGRSDGGAGVADPTPGEDARVVGVAGIANDGTHIYYVARGVLTEALNSDGEGAQDGAYNLYDFDTATHSTTLVAVLMDAAEAHALEETVKSEVEEPVIAEQERCEGILGRGGTEEEVEECDAELELLRGSLPAKIAERVEETASTDVGLVPNGEGLFETTADGGFLIFVSARDLTGPEDTSTVRQLFEYDAATGVVARVSVGEHGYNNDGNTTNAEYAPRIVVPNYAHGGAPTTASSSLSVSEVGSVFFTSRDRLVPSAVEGHENVYEYEPPGVAGCAVGEAGGCQSVIAAGDEPVSSEEREKPRLMGVDQSGSDVFFVSFNGLVPRDSDSQLDWYDARVEGGFEEAAASPSCSLEACQGASATAPLLPSLGGSAAQAAEPPVSALPVTKAVPQSPKRLSAAQQLTKALKKCKRQSRKRRRSCEAQARKRFAKKAAVKSAGGKR